MIQKIRGVSWLILALLLLPAWSWAATLSGTSGDVTWSYDTDTKTVTVSPTTSGSVECSTGNYHGPSSWNYPSGTLGSAQKGDYTGKPPFVTVQSYYSGWWEKNITIAKNATKIIVEEGVTEIGAAFFSEMSKVTSITLPNSLTTISYEAFRGCSSLTSLTLGPNVCTIRERWITDCPSLVNVNLNGNSCYQLDLYGALYTADGETLVRVPEGMCLDEISIKDGVKVFATDALYKVTCLKSITVPSSIETIQFGVFDDLPKLTQIKFKSEHAPKFENYYIHGRTNFTSLSVFVPCIPDDPDRVQEYSDSIKGTVRDTVDYKKEGYTYDSSIGKFVKENSSEVYSLDISRVKGWITENEIIAVVADADAKKGTAWSSNVSDCTDKSATVTATAYNGYRFLHWERKSNKEIVKENPHTFTAEYRDTFVAYFALDSCGLTVIAKPEQGSTKGAGIYDKDTQVEISATPTVCYEFEKWNDGNTENPRKVVVTQDTTFTAIFKLKPLSVDLSVNDATMGSASLSSENVYCGDKVTVTATPVANHHFLYWETESLTKIATSSFDTVANGNMKFKAYFAIDSFQVRFLDYDGKELCKDTLAYGATPDCEEPSRATTKQYEYEFKGWKPEISSVTKAQDYEAVYDSTGAKYTLHIVINEIVKDTAYEFNTEVKKPAKPAEKTGHTFNGWTDKAGNEVTFGFNMPAKDTTVYAKFTKNQYHVIFKDGFGGTTIKDTLYTYNKEAVKEYAHPTHDCYSFDGWFNNNGEKVVFGFEMPAKDTTIIAKYSINKHTITYYDRNNNVIKAFEHNCGSEVAQQDTTPKEKGYTFKYWSDKKDGSEVTFGFTMPDADSVLYSVWETNKYNLTLKANEGTISETETEKSWEKDFGTVVSKPVDDDELSRMGYTFQGWADKADATAANVVWGFQMDDHDTTLYAVWKINQYTLTFETNGGSTIDSIKQDFDSEVTVPADPTKSCYTFEGWYDNDEFNNEVSIPTKMPAQNVTFYAKWNIIEKNVTFMSDDAEYSSSVVACGTTVEAPKDPAKEGYTFQGWATDEAGKNVATVPFEMGSNDTTFYAIWTINAYTLTFNTDGGSTIDPITKDYGTPIDAVADPTKDCYTFEGWYDKDENEVTIPATMPAKDSTFYAKWNIITKKVRFMSDGVEYSSADVACGSDVAAPTNPVKEGHTFEGWAIANVDEDGDGLIDATATKATLPFTMGSNDTTFYAVWTINNYSLTFIYNCDDAVDENGNGDYGRTISQPYGTEVTAPTVTSPCYDFKGWFNEQQDGIELTVPSTMPAQDILYYAHWTNKTFTATFKKGGKVVSETSVKSKASVGTPADPDSLGYTFSGWYVGTEKIDFTTYKMPCSDVEFEAGFTVNSYALKFLNADGTKLDSMQVEYGTDITGKAPATTPEWKGHTFTGWSPELSGTMPAHDLTLTAQYNVNSYYLTLLDWDDKQIAKISYNFGASVPVPSEKPSREGYTFKGWSGVKDDATKLMKAAFEMPSHDTTLYAVYSVNKYTITFKKTEDKVISSEEMEFGATINKPADPTMEGYTFTGWSPEVDATVPAKDMTYTAQWQINTHTIVFKTENCKDTIKAITAEYGTAIVPPTDEETALECCYHFIGWNGTVPATMPDEDMEFCAKYLANRHNVTFEYSKGSPDNRSVAYGETVEKFAIDPGADQGYTFVGWFSKKGELAVFPFSMPDHDTTFVDSFRVNQYSVTFVNCDVKNDTIKSYVADYGSPIVLPTEEELYKEGYSFVKWGIDPPKTVAPVNLEYCANYKINKYAVIYKDYNGTTLYTDSVEYSNSVRKTATNPARTGYTFAGWVDKDSKAIEFGFSMPAHDTVVTASYNINKYTVTFVNCGNTKDTIKSVTANYGTKLDAPTASERYRVGYTFKDWNEQIPSSIPAKNVTFCATYDINSYTVYYVDYDGTKLSTESVEYNVSVRKPAENPSREGYTFAGWVDNKDANKAKAVEHPFTMPAKDTIIYASYNVNKYHVTFYDNDSTTILKDVYADYGSVVVAPTAPAKEGRAFVNWGVDEVPAKVIAKDTNLYANYKVLDYTITFKNYNDTVLVAYTLPYGSEVVNVPNVPARTGYTFNGWREAVPATIPAKDVVCKAQFSINQYTVSFFNADGTLIVMTLGDYGNSLQEPSKNMVKVAEGYSFVGWNEVLPATIPACDTSFYAVLERNDYVITFQDYDKSVIQRDTLKFEDRIVVPTVDAREGYTFTGWDKEVPATVPSSNLTFTAKYTINKHNVVFKDFDESVIAQQTVTYGESISEPTVSRTGYTFTGWDKEVPASMPDSSLEFIAQYKVNAYVITYNDYDGSKFATDTVDFGAPIVAKEGPTRTGYTFETWSPALPDTMSDNNITVVAKYKQNAYILNFKYYDEKENFVSTKNLVGYGNAITAPTLSKRTGYTFTGWVAEVPATMPDSNLVCEAQYSLNKYYIVYKEKDDSKTYFADSLEYGATIDVPTPDSREGLSFAGWDETLVTVPAVNVTIYALWDTVKFELACKDYNDSLLYSDSLKYGAEVNVPVTPTRVGHTFAGWSPEQPSTMPAKDVELIAQYTVNRYELVFEDEDGNEIKRDTLDYGDTIVPPADPEKEGYDFVEWKDLPETMIDEDIVVRPEWREQDIEFTLEDMEALLSRHCEGEEVQVSYSYTSGKPLSYKFYFSEEAVAAGFPSEQSGELGENGELYLNIPMGVDKGEYGVELQFFGKEKESGKTAFTVSTNISSSRLLKMWDDVVVCNNADNMFVSYQWYKDGEEIDGATGQYYCELGGLEGDYSVKVVTVDGEELFVCKKHFDRVEPPFSIAVYPNPAKANEDFTLEVKGLTEEEFASARIFVYTANGVLAYSTKRVSDRNSISLPVGEYVALVVLEGRSAYCKVLVR